MKTIKDSRSCKVYFCYIEDAQSSSIESAVGHQQAFCTTLYVGDFSISYVDTSFSADGRIIADGTVNGMIIVDAKEVFIGTKLLSRELYVMENDAVGVESFSFIEGEITLQIGTICRLQFYTDLGSLGERLLVRIMNSEEKPFINNPDRRITIHTAEVIEGELGVSPEGWFTVRPILPMYLGKGAWLAGELSREGNTVRFQIYGERVSEKQ